MLQSLDTEMLEYWTDLEEGQKKSFIALLKSFAKSKVNSERATIESYNKEIEDVMNRVNNGHFITQEELEREMKNL